MRCFSKLFSLSLLAIVHAKNVPASRLSIDSHPTIPAMSNNKPFYAAGDFLEPAQLGPLGSSTGNEGHSGNKALFERNPAVSGNELPLGESKEIPNYNYAGQHAAQAPLIVPPEAVPIVKIESVAIAIDTSIQEPTANAPFTITSVAIPTKSNPFPPGQQCVQISDGQIQCSTIDDPPTLLPPGADDPVCHQISDGQVQCQTTGALPTYLYQHQAAMAEAAMATAVDNGNTLQKLLYVREAPNVSNSPRVKILGFIWLGVCILLGTVLLMS
ncbi:hypothetical protein K440DRAFT_639091 [Wilcoxina mikolae CBS 423.85]|nr:hypothetical protein K440DRAFT_639091 [Wilcoxina mikolae CBS 423.85]